MRRVVVTGFGGVTPLGNDWSSIREKMVKKETAVRRMPEWERFSGVNTRLAAPVLDTAFEERYSRKAARTMGRISKMAVYATEQAFDDAGLTGDPLVKSGRCGVAYGSSFGSPGPVIAFAELMTAGASKLLNATSYIHIMGHTAAVNIGLFFGLTGRVIPTSAACTSSSMAIGYAHEAIQAGKADVMVAGGAEELDISGSAVFDTLFATSTRNDEPSLTPRPYDVARDGLVIGEGAVSLILEEREHALARGATIYAEIAGFATNSDGCHATQPQMETMALALQGALRDANLPPEAIGFVSGHGTATDGGDIAESHATRSVFRRAVPIHSLKSYFGHTLGACGGLEAWLGVEMMRAGSFMPTINLDTPDPRCAELDYLMGSPRALDVEYLMSNNFAFGGINTSLIFKRA